MNDFTMTEATGKTGCLSYFPSRVRQSSNVLTADSRVGKAYAGSENQRRRIDCSLDTPSMRFASLTTSYESSCTIMHGHCDQTRVAGAIAPRVIAATQHHGVTR